MLARPRVNVFGFLFLTASVVSTSASAQVAGGSLPQDISRQGTVVVTTIDGHSLRGRVERLSPDEITLLTRDHRVETLTADRVGRIVVKDPIRNGLLVGLAIGAAAGIAGGAVIEAICENETGGCPGVFFLLGGIGAGVGAAIGAGADGFRHRVALDRMPGLPAEYSPEVFASVGGGRFNAYGRGHGAPPNVGGGWLIRHASGLAFEVRGTRDLVRPNLRVSCMKPDARYSGAPGDACLGPGEEGVSDTTTGAADVAYFFSRSRVQPYVLGGVGLVQSTIHSARPVRGYPFIVQGLFVERDLTGVIGGGAKIMLGRSVSLRPDVTLYGRPQWNHLRLAVGVAYAWKAGGRS